jgi:hypothetical protein
MIVVGFIIHTIVKKIKIVFCDNHYIVYLLSDEVNCMCYFSHVVLY